MLKSLTADLLGSLLHSPMSVGTGCGRLQGWRGLQHCCQGLDRLAGSTVDRFNSLLLAATRVHLHSMKVSHASETLHCNGKNALYSMRSAWQEPAAGKGHSICLQSAGSLSQTAA
jgi:hypothetical protein